MLSALGDRSGVLPSQYLEQAIAAGMIYAPDDEVPAANIQPASIDLRLGAVAHRLRCSFLPGAQTVAQRLDDVIIDTVSLADGAILAPGMPYLIPLKECLALPQELHAKANPKSSTGRADVFTRVITDRSIRFDQVAPGYHGMLYLEVVPLSFPIRVREDLTLNQLRLSKGRTSLNDDDIRAFHQSQPLLFARGQEVNVADLQLADGLFLGLNLKPGKPGQSVGYRAQMSPPLLDLTTVGQADPALYWEPVRAEAGNRIVLTRKQFYLLMSYEAVTIPPTLAAEMTAYDPTSGELRTHYAGFFDPGFGYDEGDRFHGSTAALEVRAHDVDFMIEHRQPVCKLTFEHMLEEPEQLYGKGIGSNYQRQTETLGKHFRIDRSAGGAGGAGSSKRAAAVSGEQLELLGADD